MLIGIVRPHFRWRMSRSENRLPLFRDMRSKFAHHVLTKTVDRALAGERDQRDLAGLPGLEAHRGARRDVEPHAARLLAIELQRRIGIEEMIVRADLDRPVAGVGDGERHGLATGVEGDLAGLDEQLARDHGALVLSYHRIGSCTVTSFVPSGNVASTWISGIISAMPSITWARVMTWAPACMSSATLLPSRAPSRMKSEISATASGWLSLTPRSSRRRATIAAMAINSLSFSRGVRFIVAPQSSQSRGNGPASSAARTVARSRRRVAPSCATRRATTRPFQAEMPTSPEYCVARTAATRCSSPGTSS